MSDKLKREKVLKFDSDSNELTGMALVNAFNRGEIHLTMDEEVDEDDDFIDEDCFQGFSEDGSEFSFGGEERLSEKEEVNFKIDVMNKIIEDNR